MYIALRSFKYKTETGEYRIARYGAPIPEADGWKSAKTYVERGWICLEGDKPRGGRGRHSSRFQEPVVASAESEPVDTGTGADDGTTEPPASGDDTAADGETPTVAADGAEEAVTGENGASDAPSAADTDTDAVPTEPEPVADVVDEPESEPEPARPELTLDSVSRMSKGELQEIAATMGIATNQSKTKLEAAILSSLTAP